MINFLEIVLILSTSFLATYFIIPQLNHVASKVEFLDYPNKRKVHNIPKPFVGGVAIIMALCFSGLLFISFASLKGFCAGICLLAIAGFLDDLRGIKAHLKFLAQILAAVYIVYFGDTILLSFGNLLSFASFDIGLFAIPVTIFCMVGVINAINMIDGLDGLAGGISFVAFFSFALLSYINHQKDLMLLSIAMMGATAGFLKYNWNAKVFMGDSGSNSLGFALAFLAIAVTQKEKSIVPPVAALLILTVPIVDTVMVMIKRTIKGKSPFFADKTHLHHMLLRFGFGKKRAVKIIVLLSAILSLLAIAGTILKIPEHYLFSVFIIYVAVSIFISAYIKDLFKIKLKVNQEKSAVASRNGWFSKLAKMFDTATKVKRKYERYTSVTPLPCYIRQNGSSFTGTVKDFGLGGFSASLKESISRWEEVEVDLSFMKDNKHTRHSLPTEIVWSVSSNGGYRYGFKFVGRNGSQAEVLKNFLSQEFVKGREVQGYEHGGEQHYQA